MKNFILETVKRATSDTPSFFKKLRTFGGSLALMGGSLQAIPNLSITIYQLGSQCIIIGSVIAAISQLTVKSPDQL